MAEQPIERTTDDARAGETRGRVRWILIVSTIVVAAVFIWIAFSTPTNDNLQSGPAPASATS
jgi:flagellar basal body-associated protein FliL